MPPRQQRGPNNRGQVLPVARRYVPDMGWQVGARGPGGALPTAAWCTIVVTLSAGKLFVTGTPAFFDNAGHNAIAIANIQATAFDVQFDGPLNTNFQMFLNALDPAARSSAGGYLAPAGISFINPNGTPPNVIFTDGAAPISGNTVWIPNTGIFDLTLSTGTFGEWTEVPNAIDAISDVTVLGGTGSPTVTPGTVGTWTHDGAAWIRT